MYRVPAMKFGLFDINQGACLDPKVLLRIAQQAEAAGLESLWAGEHVVLPDPHVAPSPMEPTEPILDPVIALTFAAAVTTTLRLGTGVIILPQRNPLVLGQGAGQPRRTLRRASHLWRRCWLPGTGVSRSGRRAQRPRTTKRRVSRGHALNLERRTPRIRGPVLPIRRSQRLSAAGAAADALTRDWRTLRCCLPSRGRTGERLVWLRYDAGSGGGSVGSDSGMWRPVGASVGARSSGDQHHATSRRRGSRTRATLCRPGCRPSNCATAALRRCGCLRAVCGRHCDTASEPGVGRVHARVCWIL